jgi:hypothetical protein
VDWQPPVRREANAPVPVIPVPRSQIETAIAAIENLTHKVDALARKVVVIEEKLETLAGDRVEV